MLQHRARVTSFTLVHMAAAGQKGSGFAPLHAPSQSRLLTSPRAANRAATGNAIFRE